MVCLDLHGSMLMLTAMASVKTEPEWISTSQQSGGWQIKVPRRQGYSLTRGVSAIQVSDQQLPLSACYTCLERTWLWLIKDLGSRPEMPLTNCVTSSSHHWLWASVSHSVNRRLKKTKSLLSVIWRIKWRPPSTYHKTSACKWTLSITESLLQSCGVSSLSSGILREIRLELLNYCTNHTSTDGCDSESHVLGIHDAKELHPNRWLE